MSVPNVPVSTGPFQCHLQIDYHFLFERLSLLVRGGGLSLGKSLFKT